jgi:3-oxoacyl-[acyl-carrier-protein] synthase-1
MGVVKVISCGGRTPVGKLARTSAAAMWAGISRLQEHPYMVDRAGEPYMLGAYPGLEAVGRLDRLLVLAHAAIADALAELGQPLPRMPAIVAVSEVEASETESFARLVKERLTLLLAPVQLDLMVVPLGNAGGFVALQTAISELQTGRHPLFVVAGADSFIDADLLDALDVESRLACDRHRWGFPPGEAAAAMVLASPGGQQGHRLRCMGEILSVAIDQESNHARAETPCTGQGLGAAITAALLASGTQRISTTLCDLDGERYRDREYTWATQRLPTGLAFDPTSYHTLTTSCGAIGGATTILALVTALCWAERGHYSDSDVLAWAGSESGLRGAAVLRTGPSTRWRAT